jgi:hypothetical protein
MKKYLLLFVCLLVTTWAGATTYSLGTGSSLVISDDGTTATLNVGTAGDFYAWANPLQWGAAELTAMGNVTSTLTVTGNVNGNDLSKLSDFASKTIDFSTVTSIDGLSSLALNSKTEGLKFSSSSYFSQISVWSVKYLYTLNTTSDPTNANVEIKSTGGLAAALTNVPALGAVHTLTISGTTQLNSTDFDALNNSTNVTIKTLDLSGSAGASTATTVTNTNITLLNVGKNTSITYSSTSGKTYAYIHSDWVGSTEYKRQYVTAYNATAGQLSTILGDYTSLNPYKLSVEGPMNQADFTTVVGTTATVVNLENATLSGITDFSTLTFGTTTNSSVQYCIMPTGMTSIPTTWTSLFTNLKSTISYTMPTTTGTTVNYDAKLVGYVKEAGTLNDVISLSELSGGQNYRYYFGDVTLSGNLLASDLATSSSIVNTDGHLKSESETAFTGITGLNNAGSITSITLTDADFANNEDMNFAKLGLGKLATVNLPLAADMTRIPESCFMNNGVLKEICIPSNYHEIGSNAFANVYTLSHVYTTGTNTKVKYDNGENTITLSENITKIETGTFANVKKFTDVYCLSTKAPKCAADAFDAISYYGHGGHTPSTPITRASYANGDAFAILHYPTGTSDSEVKNYTDVDRVYSIVDETQATDGYGNTMVWPTQQEYYKAESQAYAGQTWKAWTDGVYSNGVVYTTEAAVTAAGLTSDATQKYNGTDYTGWHQFVLSAAYDYANPDKPHWNFSKIKDNQWWTICVPFDLTKSQLLTMFGDNTATDDTKYPNVCTLTKVIRDKDTKIIKLCFGENLETAATSDDAVVIQAGYPYMIKPNMLEAKDGHTYIPSNHIFAYTPSTTSTTTTLLPSYNADDNVKSTVKENGTTDAGDGFTYRFIGTYVKTLMPAHGFYLGWDTSSKSAVYYYQGNDASSKKSWNAYTCIVGAKMTATKVAQSGDFSNNTYVPAHLYITCESDLFEGNGAKVGIIFDDESTPTKINGVAFDNAAANEVTGKVYNMNGQQVRTNGSFDGLNKGVYIMNGKKYVVK